MAIRGQESQQRVSLYVDLLRRGVPAPEAFRQAFPQGIQIESREEQQQRLGKQQQSDALKGIAGTAVGALGTDYIASSIAGTPSLIGSGIKGIGSLFSSGAPAVAGTAGATGAGAGVAGTAGTVGASTAGTAGATAAGTAGATGTGAGIAGAGVGLGPIAAAIAAVMANAWNWNRVSKQTETKKGFDAVKSTARSPISWLMPMSSFGAALFGKKKTEGRSRRDALRQQLEKIGLTTEQDKIVFSDGTSFDISEDQGHDKYHLDGRGGSANHTDPKTQRVMHLANALSGVLGGEDIKAQGNMAGYLVNAALQGTDDVATAEKRLGELYSKLGANNEQGQQRINELYEKKKIDDRTRELWSLGWNELGKYGTQPQAQSAQPQPAQQPATPYFKPMGTDQQLSGGAPAQSLTDVRGPMTAITPNLDPSQALPGSALAEMFAKAALRKPSASTGRIWARM